MIEKNIVNILSDPDSVKVGVRLVGGNNADLEGRYSMTFIGEMAKQLTVAIESAASVSGISESNIQLAMIFAAGTFMEHTSDNVTYRRLLLLDGVSAPRDLWIKWTRLDGESAYTVADDVEEGNILFEIDEDVDHKIREKEYRYLIVAGGDKYRNAMSRKNVTDWRELLKRAVRRGELEKVEIEVELAPETIELEARLADVLGIEVTKEAEIELAPVDDEFERAMQKAREVAEGDAEDAEEYIPEVEEAFEVAEESEEETVEVELEEETDDESELVEEEPELIDDEIEELEELEEIDEEESVEEIDEFEGLDDDDEVEIDELTSLALAALAGAKEAAEEESEPEEEIAEENIFSENIFEIAESAEESESVEFDIPETEDEPEEEAEEELSLEESQATEDEAVLAELLALEPDYENITDESEEAEDEPTEEITVDLSDVEDSIRAEIEAKIRLEYENKARLKAEEEIAALRREQEKLRHENERILMEAKQEQERLRFEYDKLREQTKRAQAVREAQDAIRKAEQEKLRAQIETQLRAEARERERLAEAARLAIEEQRRLEAENARIARQREEEARIAEENRRRAEEEAKLEALRKAEVERIRREAEEAKAAAQKAMPEMGDGKYSYTSKSVKLIFRRSVDPNITSRIHEIIKATVEYYGKDKVYMKIKASVPDSQTVCLDFTQIPIEEMPLLGNIIKILGNSGLGIAKAIIE